MDTIVHAALEEICAQGINGISLSLLWPRLHSPLSSAGLNLCPAVKRAVWLGLAAVPGLQFRATDGSDVDPKSKSFEECESSNLTVVANEQLRRCFVGLYDVKASNITAPQQRVLERLALARENGVTQNQLCKELGQAANNFFYVVKRLECWGLITRQSTIVRTKETSGDKESKNTQPVHTNLIRLHRYALPLSSQQRLEITKENKNLEENTGENVSGTEPLEECGQDDVRVNDFLPAIKAVCDRLEQAEGKVLVVSDLKQELGYRETRGHRAWRNICNRLKQAGLVEVFEAKVDNKVETPAKSKRSRSGGKNKPVSCLRLLKKFSPKLFQQKNPDYEYDNLVSEETTTSGNQVQNSEQLVELPLEQQIYDMIDIEGPKGLLGVDVCRKLGISTKMLDNLTNTMVSRFGLHQLSENRKRGSAYRFWTRGNFCPELPNSSLSFLQDGPDGQQQDLAPVQEPSCTADADTRKNFADMDSLNSKKWLSGENAENRDAEEELHESQQGIGSVRMVACSSGSADLPHDVSIIVPGSVDGNKCISTTEASSNPLPKRFSLQEGQRYPSLTTARREIRILERLKTEKIIIKPELQRWLESFEKDKLTRMDRKTLTHCLKKLEREGKCKLMVFSIPGVSNCGQHREIHVVLHPSVIGTASELSDQVHGRLRSFEMQIRGALSHLKTELHIPVLHGIERIQNNANSDTQSAKSEVMRANGFVLAKMVRTKLLHRFLWGYVNNSARCTDVLSLYKNDPHSSCLLFGLDAAIKAMPFELFLQVVGSALKWSDMIEKCKTGCVLSDFPEEEYKSLMDTRGSGRLSWLIRILCRLQLIRLVADESPKDATNNVRTKLIYALELKPYIEEPPSTDPLPCGFGSLEPRPHVRHDFELSTSEAVDKYWQTLEYCYAAADPKAAVRVFPGSVVLEVCLYRSWTTVRVMKAEQRAELLKRIKDQSSKKLSFQECREIAKDLNLTLEQVLRVYYDNRQQRLNRFQGDLNVHGVASEARGDKLSQSLRKRKSSTEGRSAKHAKVDHTSDSYEDSQEEYVEEPEVNQEEQQESLNGHKMMPMLKQTRQQKFSWTEEADRHLLTQYARQRAMQGARRGTDWGSISDLPAPPTTCRRRISTLKRDLKFRLSLMRLCNLLTQRYAQHLDHEKKLLVSDEYGQESDSQELRWDDFDDSKIKIAFHEVLMLKKMIKSDSAKRSGYASQGTRNPVASSPCEFENDSEKQHIGSSRRSRRHRLPQKFVMHLKEGVSITRRMNQSLAVSCAVELFKLVFLTNSKASETPNLLAETLCCYSEHDLFSAFDYLRQKKILVGSGPSQPFVLSQNFLRSLSLSQLPANTGKRAAKLARWIREKEKELMEGTVNLPLDLQCGDVFHLFALVSSGEFSILPVLPVEGVGEAEDSRTAKRKYDDHEFDESGVNKKHRWHSLQDSEMFSRREKGFPGIKVSLSRTAILRSSTVDFFKDEDKEILFSKNDQFYAILGQKVNSKLSSIDSVQESPDFGNIVPGTVVSGDSIWEVITNYTIQDLAKHCKQKYVQLHPELIKTAYTNIQEAGDQGISMSKISECLGMEDIILAELVTDALQLFGLVLKVNGYNSIHVVDGQYRTKYFLTSKATCSGDPGVAPSSDPQQNEMHIVEDSASCQHEKNYIVEGETDNLNRPKELLMLSNAGQAPDTMEGCSTSRTFTRGGKESQKFDESAATFQPILPWINGDGTINVIVYRGLTRRVLGIVTQNPGILEDNILRQMEVLNPQSCRKLLDSMVLDKHLIIRKMCQSTCSTPPALLGSLFGGHLERPKLISRQHYFANPMSTTLL